MAVTRYVVVQSRTNRTKKERRANRSGKDKTGGKKGKQKNGQVENEKEAREQMVRNEDANGSRYKHSKIVHLQGGSWLNVFQGTHANQMSEN